MLATLTHSHFSHPSWIYERKLDGERCLAVRQGHAVRLYSRKRADLNPIYPELVRALHGLSGPGFVLDGEVVAFEKGVSSFHRLQYRLSVDRADPELIRRIPVTYCIFDILQYDGRDLTRLTLRERKAVLARIIAATGSSRGPLVLVEHVEVEGEKLLSECCRIGEEGVVAKRADSVYVHARSTDWLKFKCQRRQEFVVGGFTDPQRSRVGIGALLVGYWEGGRLVYAGKVGTGFTREDLLSLAGTLGRLEVREQPFAVRVPARGVHWTRPEVVAEVAFAEWTGDGRLRHPRFMGLRTDKEAWEVVRERSGT